MFIVLNFGTSCQLSYLSDCAIEGSSHALIWPYKGDKHLSVYASMNGGNVLSCFVTMLKGWMRDLGEYDYLIPCVQHFLFWYCGKIK